MREEGSYDGLNNVGKGIGAGDDNATFLLVVGADLVGPCDREGKNEKGQREGRDKGMAK